MPSVQVWKRARRAVGVALARLESGVGRTARHDEKDRVHGVFVADLVLLVRLVQIELCLDVAVGDFEARLVTAAHQAAQAFAREPVLERVGAGAAAGEHLRQFLLDRRPCWLADIGEGLVHFGLADVDAVTLGLA